MKCNDLVRISNTVIVAQVSIARKVLYIKDDNWAFPEKNCNPVEDPKFQGGGRVKVVGIPGGKPKIEVKT